MRLALISILLHFGIAFFATSQNNIQWDSSVVYKPNGTPIRFVVPRERYVNGSSSDSLLARDATTKKTTLIPQASFQSVLISGTNIKTINNQSLLGSGNIALSGTGDLLAANNLSDLANITTARTNLGLGNVTNESKATMFTSPTFTGTVTYPASQTFATPSFTTGFKIGGAAASGKIPIGDGTNFVASTPTFPNAAGTTGNVLTSDGTNFISSANTGEWKTLQVVTSDATTTGQTLADVTGLVTPTLTTSSNYEIEAMLIVTTSTGTAGTEYGVNCTGTGTTQGIIYIGPTTVSGGVQVLAENGTNTNNTAATPAMMTTASETGVVWIRGVVGTGTGTPTIAIRHLKVTSGTSTVKVGSIMRYRKL